MTAFGKDKASELRQQSEAPSQSTSAGKFSVITGRGVKRRPPSIVEKHFCVCRDGVVCICCLSWNRTIRGHEQRRADSLRRQALGNRSRAGG